MFDKIPDDEMVVHIVIVLAFCWFVVKPFVDKLTDPEE